MNVKKIMADALFPHHAPHVLLRLYPRNHNLMPTARAFQAEVRTNPQHLPLRGATGVLLFHF